MLQHRKKVLSILENVNSDEFTNSVYPKREPVILRGLDIGDCIEKWRSVEYLAKKGGSQAVKIHVTTTPEMDFINKNFAYKSLPFDEYVHRASEDVHTQYFLSSTEKFYLRALGDDPRKDIADITKQFPDLAADIRLPDFFPAEKFFSSVFRIASKGLQLWTHYDVMDNLLVQVSGKKRVVLFPPADIDNMYLNGDKSEVLDIDNPDVTKFPKFQNVTRYEGILDPGDVLFIPALWFHNVISLDFGVAVNVFWKHLEDSAYDQRDTYGNKDHTAFTRAQQITDRALKVLEELPQPYRHFYGRRLIAKIDRRTSVDKPP